MTFLRTVVRELGRAVPPIRRIHEGLHQAIAQRDEAHRGLAEERKAREAAEAMLRRFASEAGASPDSGRGTLEAELASEREARMLEQSRTLTPEEFETFARWRYLKSTDRLIAMDDFGVKPAVRFGWEKPPHPQIEAILATNVDKYRRTLESFLPLLPGIVTIPSHPVENMAEPNWINLAFPAFDAIALYGLIATRKPRRFIEIGSGFSTKFARRAIQDHGLATQIISIDPEPRAEVDAICDEVVRSQLEAMPLDLFAGVGADDFIFFDGSHRTFQNSDVTVFFTEILPMLPSGTLVGIHDIFWPADYPAPWLEWYFSEQYMLACWLLAGEKLEVELPVNYVAGQPELKGILDPYWNHVALAGASHGGGAFFFRIR
jgi:hypothetical protein